MRNDSLTEKKKEAWFSSNAVVTDIRGHIVVCDGYENTVYLLDSDGQFLRIFPQAKDRFVVPEVFTLISRTTYSLETSKMILLSYISISKCTRYRSTQILRIVCVFLVYMI